MKKIGLIASLVLMGSALFAQDIKEGKQFLNYERYESAEGVFQKLLTANPNNTEAAYWLGQTYLYPNREPIDTAEAKANPGKGRYNQAAWVRHGQEQRQGIFISPPQRHQNGGLSRIGCSQSMCDLWVCCVSSFARLCASSISATSHGSARILAACLVAMS